MPKVKRDEKESSEADDSTSDSGPDDVRTQVVNSSLVFAKVIVGIYYIIK
jgi:hypothetical protein